MDTRLYNSLRKSIIFKDVSEVNFNEIVNEIPFRILDYKKNEILFFEGDDCNSIGIVLDGEVEVNKGLTIGKKVNITKIKAGDMFAEAVVFSQYHKFHLILPEISHHFLSIFLRFHFFLYHQQNNYNI